MPSASLRSRLVDPTPMSMFEILRIVVDALDRVGIDHMISGSVASARHGEARSTQLAELGIPYKLTEGGSTVQVPSSDLDQARLDLAASNVLDGGNGVGFEIFDKSNLGATDFTNRVNLVRATEGELSRTIGRLDPVQSATVKIADAKIYPVTAPAATSAAKEAA